MKWKAATRVSENEKRASRRAAGRGKKAVRGRRASCSRETVRVSQRRGTRRGEGGSGEVDGKERGAAPESRGAIGAGLRGTLGVVVAVGLGVEEAGGSGDSLTSDKRLKTGRATGKWVDHVHHACERKQGTGSSSDESALVVVERSRCPPPLGFGNWKSITGPVSV